LLNSPTLDNIKLLVWVDTLYILAENGLRTEELRLCLLAYCSNKKRTQQVKSVSGVDRRCEIPSLIRDTELYYICLELPLDDKNLFKYRLNYYAKTYLKTTPKAIRDAYIEHLAEEGATPEELLEELGLKRGARAKEKLAGAYSKLASERGG